MVRSGVQVAESAWAKPPTDGVALRRVWEVYQGEARAIEGAITGALEADPSLAETIRVLQSRTGSREESQRITREALTSGEWEPYLHLLVEQGRSYARQGIALRVWLQTWRLFRLALRERLVAAHSEDPDLALRCLAAMEDWLEMAISIVADQYVSERDAVIRETVAVRELSTPVLALRPGLLVVPVIGTVDPVRAQQLSERLLESVRALRARAVVIDVTGVVAMDSVVAAHLLATVDACRLMGARCVVTGLSIANADALTRLRVDLAGLATAGNLEQGIQQAEGLLARWSPST
jgi:rsbT co-antagonist protein RsbR